MKLERYLEIEAEGRRCRLSVYRYGDPAGTAGSRKAGPMPGNSDAGQVEVICSIESVDLVATLVTDLLEEGGLQEEGAAAGAPSLQERARVALTRLAADSQRLLLLMVLHEDGSQERIQSGWLDIARERRLESRLRSFRDEPAEMDQPARSNGCHGK